MSDKRKILVQLDTDPTPSLFDRIVAIDAGADEVISYGGVRPEHIQRFVQDAIFTRGPKDLAHTAIFIGGSDVAMGERLFEEARKHLLPQFKLQVSMMVDSNGCNTTAVAAVSCAARYLDLANCRTAVLGGAGRVGRRIAALMLQRGGELRLADSNAEELRRVAVGLGKERPSTQLAIMAVADPSQMPHFLEGCELIFVAGPPGETLLLKAARPAMARVLVDTNAVPPFGVEGVEIGDKGKERDGVTCYGAVGVGDLKMKIHKAAVARLFERNDQRFDLKGIAEVADAIGDK